MKTPILYLIASRQRLPKPIRYGRCFRQLGILVISLLTLPGLIQAKNNFGQASDIYNVGAGARSMAMGSAFT